MNDNLPIPAGKKRRHRAADVLESFLREQTDERINMGQFVSALGDRAFGLAIFVLALANLLIANVPGISTVLGLPVILLSLQLVLGQKRPWLPSKLSKMTMQRGTLEKMVKRSVAILRKMEIFFRPRMMFLVTDKAERYLGLYCLILGIVLALPILFGNFLPAWALAFISLGLIEKDGLMTLVGLVIGALAIGYALAFYSGFVYLFDWLIYSF